MEKWKISHLLSSRGSILIHSLGVAFRLSLIPISSALLRPALDL